MVVGVWYCHAPDLTIGAQTKVEPDSGRQRSSGQSQSMFLREVFDGLSILRCLVRRECRGKIEPDGSRQTKERFRGA